MSSLDLLFEIGVEELPAGYVPRALEQLAESVREGLMGLRLLDPDTKVQCFATPRRLAVFVPDVFARQFENATTTYLGPPLTAAYDSAGAPTAALLGFCKKLEVQVSDVERSADGKRVTVTKTLPSHAAEVVLPPVLGTIAPKLQFPKSMRWDAGDYRFGRPVRWMVALLGDRVLPVQAFGLTASRASFGHRFLHPGAVDVPSAGDYINTLRKVFVLADPIERREKIKAQLAETSAAAGGTVLADEELLDINNFLVEWPTAYLGAYDSKFHELPNEVLVTAMREHQRFFAVSDDRVKKGRQFLLDRFVAVRNGDDSNLGLIAKGSEDVLTARLEDALFYWNFDHKKPPAELVDMLSSVVWMEGLGSLRDKAERLQSLGSWLAERLAPEAKETVTRAALLCKTDLLGEMIGSGKEYASLEGVIGAYYAVDSGESQEVGKAIYEHYRPRGSSDELPATDAGSLLSLADKLDHVAGAFVAGKSPSGSEDPYGVRRAANGAVRIVVELGRALDLRATAMEMTRPFFAADSDLPQAEIMKKLGEFLRSRVDTALDDRGLAYDTREAALEAKIILGDVVRPGWCDAADALARARALGTFRRDPSFESLVVLYKRVANILKASTEPLPEVVSRSLLTEEAEKGLVAAYIRAREATAPLWDKRDYAGIIPALLEMESAIHGFFDHVMVNVEDPAVRLNRLRLLADVRELFTRGWDLSKVVVEGEKG